MNGAVDPEKVYLTSSNHEWKRNAQGRIEWFGDEFEWAECRLCGTTGEDPGWNAREVKGPILTDSERVCPGVDLKILVTVSIWHPGKATEEDDGTAINKRVEIPMFEFLGWLLQPPTGIERDIVLDTLFDSLRQIVAEWKQVPKQHVENWQDAMTANRVKQRGQ